MTQGAVSKVLVRRVAAGVVRQGYGHVNGFARRVRIYRLTDRGAMLVQTYRARFGADEPPTPLPRTGG